jgi:hypothetical protein
MSAIDQMVKAGVEIRICVQPIFVGHAFGEGELSRCCGHDQTSFFVNLGAARHTATARLEAYYMIHPE